MKDKLKAIACLGLAVCVASGLWACSREDVQTEPESSNTTINYVYNGIYDISNIPEETLSGEMPVTEIETDTNGETYIVVEQPVQWFVAIFVRCIRQELLCRIGGVYFQYLYLPGVLIEFESYPPGAAGDVAHAIAYDIDALSSGIERFNRQLNTAEIFKINAALRDNKVALLHK